MDIKIKKSDLVNKHILAIDYGRKFTGLATFKVGNDPYPLCYGRVAFTDDTKLVSDLVEIIENEFIEIVVLGIPFFTDGKESTMTKTVKAFGVLLENTIKLPVFLIDETLTTFEAEDRMKNDPKYNFKVDLKKIDELSAAIILEQFLKNSSD